MLNEIPQQLIKKRTISEYVAIAIATMSTREHSRGSKSFLHTSSEFMGGITAVADQG